MEKEKEYEEAKKGFLYSVERIDLLLISVSGGGIYAIWEIYKYTIEKKLITNLFLLKIGGLLFLITIISNFVGHWFSFKTHWYDIVYLYDEKKQEKNPYNKFVLYANNISICTIILGLLAIAIFTATCL